jgi:hypothetical protein
MYEVLRGIDIVLVPSLARAVAVEPACTCVAASAVRHIPAASLPVLALAVLVSDVLVVAARGVDDLGVGQNAARQIHQASHDFDAKRIQE